MAYYGDDFKNDVVDRLDSIKSNSNKTDVIKRLDYLIHIFDEEYNGFGNSSGGDGAASGIGGAGGSGGTTSKFSKFMGKAGKVMAIANGIERSINGTLSSLKSMYGELNHIIEPWAKADKAASKYAKTLAMTEQGMKDLRRNSINNVVNSKIGINYNISTDELIEAQQKYVQNVGRSLRIDNTQQETLAAMTAVMGDRTTELAAAFENFGVNLNGVGDHAFKMFTEASKSGLSFEKYSDNVAKNIKIAQNYTFKNGLRGLEGMAKKATALKLDMSQVASFADKVSTIEGSIDVASRLQVLGGQFAAIADPMAMLSEGLMDMEGLTDRIIKMVGGLGNFNKKTGEVEVSAFNKQRIKAAAQAMGMDYSQLMESVNASTRREAIDREISSSAHARGLNEDMKELLRNSATFDKNGKAGISVNGEFVNLEDLTNADYEVLVKETQDQASDIKDIARMLRSIEDIEQGTRKQYEANKAKVIENNGRGDRLKTVISNKIGESNRLLRIIAYGSIFKSIASIGLTALSIPLNILSNFSNIKNIGKGVGRGGGRNFSSANAIAENKEGIKNVFRKSGGETLGAGKHFKKTKQVFRLVKGGKGLQVAKLGMKSVGKRLPVVGGLIAGGIEAYENKDKFKDKSTRGSAIGKTAGSAIGVGVGTLLGGALLPVLGPLGPMLGGIVGEKVGKFVGGTIGKIQDNRIIKNRAIVDKQLEKFGIERKGDYKVKHLKQIDKALKTGKMSDNLRNKLLEQGDIDLVKKIDSIKSENNIGETIKNGRFSVENAYFDGVGFGPKNFGPKNIEIKTSIDKLHENVGVVKCIPETGRGIVPHQRVQTFSQNENQGRNGYDINISGTITLVSANGQEVDITDNLLSDQTFVRSLTEKIIRQTGQNNYGVQRADVNQMGRM